MLTRHTRLLSDLLADAPPQATVGTPQGYEVTVHAIYSDSREAKKYGNHGIFVAVVGATFDGHSFLQSAYDAGCRIFAVSRTVRLPEDALCLIYPDTRIALALLSASFYGHPSRELTVVGVTGTKGKTTTCLLAESILLRAGIPTGYVGTSGIRYAGVSYESPNTTPESLVLQRTMREMLDAGVRVLVMEVSSQALMQHRVYGMDFDVTVFTNLSSDHIGPREHPSFSHYKETKRSLFTDYPARTIILNADDPHSSEMLPKSGASGVKAFSVSQRGCTDGALPSPALSATDIVPASLSDSRLGVAFALHSASKNEPIPAFLPLPGACNVQNALAALLICEALGVPLRNATEYLSEISVAGRCETVRADNGIRILIDYAHNEASLREILTALRAFDPKRLIVLFGSVGGRTRERRAPMGKVASSLADFCILTSDNPDCEPPEDILTDIERGFVRDCPHVKIPDRGEAIRYGLSIAEAGDILLLAGKGHETYQLVDGKKQPFCERAIVEEWLLRIQSV